MFVEIIFQWFCPIDCTAPSGPETKYSLLSVLSKWVTFPNRILDQSEFRLISPNGIANDFLEKDKAIEVRSEIICTRLGF